MADPPQVLQSGLKADDEEPILSLPVVNEDVTLQVIRKIEVLSTPRLRSEATDDLALPV